MTGETHVGVWRCPQSEGGCAWELRISGSETYVRGPQARRLAWLEVLNHDTREHWPSRMLGAFVRAASPEVELWPNRVEELMGSPEAELVG